MRNAETQNVVPFTGEGAYHGSTKPRPASSAAAPVPPPLVDEMRPTTIDRYAAAGAPALTSAPPSEALRGPAKQVLAIATFPATFPNRYEIVSRKTVP